MNRLSPLGLAAPALLLAALLLPTPALADPDWGEIYRILLGVALALLILTLVSLGTAIAYYRRPTRALAVVGWIASSLSLVGFAWFGSGFYRYNTLFLLVPVASMVLLQTGALRRRRRAARLALQLFRGVTLLGGLQLLLTDPILPGFLYLGYLRYFWLDTLFAVLLTAILCFGFLKTSPATLRAAALFRSLLFGALISFLSAALVAVYTMTVQRHRLGGGYFLTDTIRTGGLSDALKGGLGGFLAWLYWLKRSGRPHGLPPQDRAL